MIAALKFLHVAALACWCASLIALPLLMRAHGGAMSQRQYARFRLITHIGYIGIATPAALVTIMAGTGLIFAAQVFAPWLLVKLAFVAAMVMVHVWFGHLIQRSGEERRSQWQGAPLAGLLIVLPLMAAVLALVLAKPDLAPFRALIPDQFLSPRAGSS
ncbi:CopD family protein [Paracoccus sp. IB05]|uniref:CopD family protein n=1 Tax=Paracoccus sp. IB05 TaxID=2779367 RepID=UPI0018E8BB2A|nr:CopD family protein [Paracoccus sp. IB05]MBJ2149787.1 CopD family protein [Paracoccus sp. IB05]